MNTGRKPRALQQKSVRKLINSAMRKLPEADYDILYELYFKHISVHQLSRSLGISCPAVRYRRDKALKQLKKIILKKQKK
jgi:RNA polymerase sigma factor (sigma-70 family)